MRTFYPRWYIIRTLVHCTRAGGVACAVQRLRSAGRLGLELDGIEALVVNVVKIPRSFALALYYPSGDFVRLS